MDWATAIATNPITPWGIVSVIVIATLSGLLQPWRNIKRERAQFDAQIARTETIAAAAVQAAEAARIAEVERVEKLHERELKQKNELLAEQSVTIKDLTASVRMYALAAEADITTADIVKSVIQGLQADAAGQNRPQRQLEGGPNG